MVYLRICPVGSIGGQQDLLTYHSPQDHPPGSVVEVPYGQRQRLGIVLESVAKPAFVTKPIGRLLPERVPSPLLAVADWLSQYYVIRLPLVMPLLLPRGAGKTRRPQTSSQTTAHRPPQADPLTKQQKRAITAMSTSTAITHLLHGVTGSGKTRVYQELASRSLDQGKSTIVLVPEIALTSQLVAEFSHLTDNIALLHSGLTEAQRHRIWQQIQTTPQPWVVIGPRSALFAPLSSLGLIIIDECHEPSFVQDSQPKYSALRVARKLAELHPGAKLILGSATPLVTDYYLAEQTNTPIIELSQSISGQRPVIKLVDMRHRALFSGHPFLSQPLLQAIEQTLARRKQVLLFHNRRGTARLALCETCGWVAHCPHCHTPLRLHHDQYQLICHTCGYQQTVVQQCPDCQHSPLQFRGFGSKRIEQDIAKLFPAANIARFDSDTLKHERLQNRYQEVYDNHFAIIIGTQGVAKGLDLPHLDLVGLIQAETELFIPDYSSQERAFQLISQSIGRAGRQGQASQVIIQTYNPDHPILQQATKQNYQAFYTAELAERRAAHLPPFSFLLQLTVGYRQATKAQRAAQQLADQLKSAEPSVLIRGPLPSFHEYRGNLYYWQLVLVASSRKVLVRIAQGLPSRWQFTLDPPSLIR